MFERQTFDWGFKFVPMSILFSNINSRPRITDLLVRGFSIASDPEITSTGAYAGRRRANARQFGNRLFSGGVISCSLHDLTLKDC